MYGSVLGPHAGTGPGRPRRVRVDWGRRVFTLPVTSTLSLLRPGTRPRRGGSRCHGRAHTKFHRDIGTIPSSFVVHSTQNHYVK